MDELPPGWSIEQDERRGVRAVRHAPEAHTLWTPRDPDGGVASTILAALNVQWAIDNGYWTFRSAPTGPVQQPLELLGGQDVAQSNAGLLPVTFKKRRKGRAKDLAAYTRQRGAKRRS